MESCYGSLYANQLGDTGVVLSLVAIIVGANSVAVIRSSISWMCSVCGIMTYVVASSLSHPPEGDWQFTYATLFLVFISCMAWHGRFNAELSDRREWLKKLKLEKHEKWLEKSMPNTGRANSSLNFRGRQVASQRFFIASFPGVYEKEWTEMTQDNALVPPDELIATACT